MSTANVRLLDGEDIPLGTVSCKIDMDAFDRLSPQLRARVASMAVNWNAVGVRHIANERGERVALAVLDKVDGDMMAAYERRLPCRA